MAEDDNIKQHIKFGNVDMRLPKTAKAIELARRLLDIFGEDLEGTENKLLVQELMANPVRRTCKFCGSTEDNACPGGCSWVAPGICSRCADQVKPKTANTFVIEQGKNTKVWEALVAVAEYVSGQDRESLTGNLGPSITNANSHAVDGITMNDMMKDAVVDAVNDTVSSIINNPKLISSPELQRGALEYLKGYFKTLPGTPRELLDRINDALEQKCTKSADNVHECTKSTFKASEVEGEVIKIPAEPAVFKECKPFKWYGLPTYRKGKTIYHCCQGMVHIMRERYGDTQVWAKVEDLKRLKELSSKLATPATLDEYNATLAGTSTLKQYVIKGFLRDVDFSKIGVEGNGSQPKTEAQEGEVVCPDCGSTRLWKEGSVTLATGIKYKYSCRDCDRRFLSDINRPRKDARKAEHEEPQQKVITLNELLVPIFEHDHNLKTAYKTLKFTEMDGGMTVISYSGTKLYVNREKVLQLPNSIPHGYFGKLKSGTPSNQAGAIRLYREYLFEQAASPINEGHGAGDEVTQVNEILVEEIIKLAKENIDNTGTVQPSKIAKDLGIEPAEVSRIIHLGHIWTQIEDHVKQYMAKHEIQKGSEVVEIPKQKGNRYVKIIEEHKKREAQNQEAKLDIEKTAENLNQTEQTEEKFTPVIKYTDGNEAKPEDFQPAGGPGKKNKDGITVSDQYEFCLNCPHRPMEPEKESCKICVHRQGELVKQFLRGSLGREPTEEEVRDAYQQEYPEGEDVATSAENERLKKLKEKEEINKRRWGEKDEKDEDEQKAPEPETSNVADVTNVTDTSNVFMEAEKFDCSKMVKSQVGTSIVCKHADGRIAIRQANYKDVITTTDVWITTLKGLSKEALKETLKSLNGAKQWMLKKYIEDLKDEEMGAFGKVRTDTRRPVEVNE
jgi:transposase-like protein